MQRFAEDELGVRVQVRLDDQPAHRLLAEPARRAADARGMRRARPRGSAARRRVEAQFAERVRRAPSSPADRTDDGLSLRRRRQLVCHRPVRAASASACCPRRTSTTARRTASATAGTAFLRQQRAAEDHAPPPSASTLRAEVDVRDVPGQRRARERRSRSAGGLSVPDGAPARRWRSSSRSRRTATASTARAGRATRSSPTRRRGCALARATIEPPPPTIAKDGNLFLRVVNAPASLGLRIVRHALMRMSPRTRSAIDGRQRITDQTTGERKKPYDKPQIAGGAAAARRSGPRRLQDREHVGAGAAPVHDGRRLRRRIVVTRGRGTVA